MEVKTSTVKKNRQFSLFLKCVPSAGISKTKGSSSKLEH